MTTSAVSLPSPTGRAAAIQRAGTELLSTTPGRLKAAGGAISLLALLLWSLAHSAIGIAYTGVQTIGKDSVPSIVAAQQLEASLADMDANADNGFFSRGTKAALAAYETDRQKACSMLVSAAKNITYGDEEQAPILAIQDSLQVYIGLVERSRTLGYPKGLDTLRQASDLMHSKLIPAAEALDAANFKHLNIAYENAQSGLPAARGLLLAGGFLTLLVLLATQAYLLARMKRIINPGLASATVVLLIWLMATFNTTTAIQHALKVAKKDAFDSIDAMMRARSVAYDANGDESLYLLEHGSRSSPDVVQKLEASFRQKSAMIADTQFTPEVISQAQEGNVKFKGYLGDELANITFDGEKQAAINAVTTFAAYMQMDAHLRELENSDKHQEAVEFCTGTQEGQSNWGFAQFDAAIGKVIEINQAAFDNQIARGFRALSWLPAGATIAALLIALLSWVGLTPRIREYAG